MAFNALSEFAKSLTPSPPYTDYEYDGLQYRWKSFVFRPALFQVEAILLAALSVYFAVFFVGKTLNKKRADTWLQAYLPLLSQQFSKPTSTAGIIADGYSDYFNFSTGRKNIASLHCVFSLLPRHDLARMVYRFVWGMIDLVYSSEDELVLDFKLQPSTSTPGFVWGVASKDCLAKVKQGRWDLTFTRTTESPLLGGGYCVMSEYADVTETLLKPSGQFSIVQALNDPAVKPYVKSLTITDQPRERPLNPIPTEERERHVLLSLRLPSNAQHSATAPLVKTIFALIDALESPKFSLRPETRTKLRKTREEIDDTLRKEAEAGRREEAELDKAAARKKAEDERIGKLSAAEQKKELERDRKRQVRKAQGKTVKK
ncbi:hypothetical protein M0805_007421 [Coniferiporia weirii]|nr:hypothetical protein M0805_007421 [Coniferiporia weirii]